MRSLVPSKLSHTQELYQLVKSFKYLSLADVHRYAKKWGKKQRTLERRLNKSEAPSWVETVYNRGIIVGYKYKRSVKVIV